MILRSLQNVKMTKLSVLIPTFNHHNFIAKTLEGALMQKTNFDFEIVIGDDASSDGNQLVIQEFVDKYPDKIRAFLHPENLGPSSPRELGGKNNVAFLFGVCKGDYIALCEGDDFWTDPLKLQKQVDFLDSNPDYSLCHHQLSVIYEDNTPTHDFNIENQRDTSLLGDLLEDKLWFLGTASTVLRNVFKNGLPKWWWKSASGDLGIFIEVAKYGKIKYLPDNMGCYRKHHGGMTNIHTPQNIFFLRNRMEMFQALDGYFDLKYSAILVKTISYYHKVLTELEKNV